MFVRRLDTRGLVPATLGALALALAGMSSTRAAADPLAAMDALAATLAVAVDSNAATSADSLEAAPDTISIPAPAAGAPDTVVRRRHGQNAVQVFAGDAWYVVSSPARMNWEGAAWTAGVLGATAVLYANDEQILRTLRRQGSVPIYRAVLDVGEFVEPAGFMGRTNVYYAGGLVIGYVFKIRPLTTVTSEILESHMISGGIRNLAKLAVGRAQPHRGEGPHHFTPGHGTSFPSGHSSVIFELATIASMNARRWPVTVVTYSLATALALQRIDARAHWASDVLPSAVSGYWISRTIVQRHRQRAAEDKASGRVGLVPDPRGLRVAWTF